MRVIIQHNFQSSDNQILHSRLADDDKSSSPSQGSDEVRNVIMCCQVRNVKVRLSLKRNVTPCVLAVKAGKYKQHFPAPCPANVVIQADVVCCAFKTTCEHRAYMGGSGCTLAILTNCLLFPV